MAGLRAVPQESLIPPRYAHGNIGWQIKIDGTRYRLTIVYPGFDFDE
jgi:hypothetical protein